MTEHPSRSRPKSGPGFFGWMLIVGAVSIIGFFAFYPVFSAIFPSLPKAY